MIGRHTGRVELSWALTSEECLARWKLEDALPFGRAAEREGEKGPIPSEVGLEIDGVKTPYTADLYGANKLDTNTQRWSKQRKRTRRSVKSLTGGG